MNFTELTRILDQSLSRDQCFSMAKLMGIKDTAGYINVHNVFCWMSCNYNWKTGTVYLDLNDVSLLRMLLNNPTVGASNLVQYVDQYWPYEKNRVNTIDYLNFKNAICNNLTAAQCVNIVELLNLPNQLSPFALLTEMERRCYIGREDVSQLYVLFQHPTVHSDHFDFNRVIAEYERKYCLHEKLATKMVFHLSNPQQSNIVRVPQLASNQARVEQNNLNEVKQNDQSNKPSKVEQHKPSDKSEESEQRNQIKVECLICFDQPRNIVLIPCGHICVCSNCSGDLKICPMCREIIKIKQPFFVS